MLAGLCTHVPQQQGLGRPLRLGVSDALFTLAQLLQQRILQLLNLGRAPGQDHLTAWLVVWDSGVRGVRVSGER